MRKKFLFLGGLLVVPPAVILMACHTEEIGLATHNNTGCTMPLVTYKVPSGSGMAMNPGPHQLTHANVANGTTTSFDPLGAGYPPEGYPIQAQADESSCCAAGGGTIPGIAPGFNYTITWTCGTAEDGKTHLQALAPIASEVGADEK